MQLVAYGAQDVYLSGNPQITFFKVVYRRHTNFSVEPIQQTWNGAGDFGRSVTCNINRNGDLITNMYIVVTLKDTTNDPSYVVPWGFVNRLGHAMIEYCKIEIGGSLIDQHYGDWLNIWYELTHKIGQESGYAKMIGDVPSVTTINPIGYSQYTMYVPLIFWFNRNNGLALPLIALQYHDVRVTLKFVDADNLINYVGQVKPTLPSTLMQDTYLLIDYIYLDSEERKRFAQASHEYLIEQLQFTGSESLTAVSNKYRLNFNHPCKYLVWAPQLDRFRNRNQWIAWPNNNNWNQVKDRFAKLVYIAFSNNLSYSMVPGVGTAPSTYLITNNGSTSVNAGDLYDPGLVQITSPAVSNWLNNVFANKVEVKMVRQDTPSGAGAPAVLTQVMTTSSMALTDILNNTIVIKNDLTMEDISQTFATLCLYAATSGTYTYSGPNPSAPANVLSLGIINAINYSNYGNFIDGSDNPVYNGKLQLNGHDRFQARDGHYFNYVQPFQHFSNTPADGINVYSFALKAEDHQPSGTCNFSRIDNATLQVDCGLYNNSSATYNINYIGQNSSSLLNIYTTNYNVLRVMSGMAGTAYSN